ncbi:PTS system IIA component, Fru family [Thermoanaerobacter thermohydrosulfuricus]|uniref:PTS system, fructose subfamily, IIA component n=6 Tax=Thermoanaerobacter TaxID=1754 RepID=I9KSB0_9THEO|nr:MULTISPECIES: PTS sugar transporter subunit IIA [Thermoanaerobacter]EGD51289.1 putative PTS IIA-like nitrogen-regulatory protein PtsN [Thermoanaerobacter ethanolicus JW 200]ABY94001.1 putative PTS IIA-like nitrogen-regulatory protein PtsN [Thermoanaerobacter pseudethanolicus ATCC 33223]ADV78958.1 PTS system, fructose subfamily, IIA subunit [Thermoanaerobacter brockii subsp. finnii Ako-1]AEM79647.1 putative PTS IIA-like nitrogen-regulatory protein PtsN [Thermoanaerobacter wiegelii Rt8.B1]EIV
MLINKNLVTLNLEAKNKEEAIIKLAELAQKEGKITSVEEYARSVLDREKAYTTGVGNGIAIPHGKSKAVKEAMIVFGKTTDGIEWDSLDGKPVNLIFLLGVPEENVDNVHLKILSQLSRKLMNDSFIEMLKKAVTVEEILNALSDIQVS